MCVCVCVCVYVCVCVCVCARWNLSKQTIRFTNIQQHINFGI